MAPTPSYYTPADLEGLQAPAPTPPAAVSWAWGVAGAFGFGCVAALALSGPATTVLPATPPPTRVAAAPAVAPATLLQRVGTGMAAVSLSALAHLGTPAMAPAMELDLLSAPTPTEQYVFDDGGFLSKATQQDLAKRLPDIERRTGYRINVVTLRKLGVSDDAFAFADKLIEEWYPTAELGDKKAIFVLVKTTKEGGIVGGPAFSQQVPDSVLESIINDNIGKLLPKEKFNQALSTSLDRLDAVLSGKADPGAPKGLAKPPPPPDASTATYKTKEQTDEKKSAYVGIFGALVAISFIAPMVQYFGYTRED